ncbi:MAG: hypothetical protein JWM82_4141 [Myxococcales bacterium]|nr:hypothetical protein [Myxococcales bacterium]
MPLSPRRATFIVPASPELPSNTSQAQKPAREAMPFVVVPKPLAPEALAAGERDALEPHWHVTIDAATD